MKRMLSAMVACLALAAVTHTVGGCGGGPVDLTTARVVADTTGAARTAATILVNEVEKRTGIRWNVGPEADGGATIRLVLAPQAGISAEGYRIATSGGPELTITAGDGRGLVYGVGHLLRKLHWRQGSTMLPAPLSVETAPAYSIRGHQLAYGSMNNTYDAWDLPTYRQYIREQMVFGMNTIRNRLPTARGRMRSPMRVDPVDVGLGLSAFADSCGIDYWVSVPVTFDLDDTGRRAEHLRGVEEAFRSTPRIDNLFVPGGDPGVNHPRLLMPYVEELASALRRHHPEAGVWVSLQKFWTERTDWFFSWLDETNPPWLTGIIDGPWGPPVSLLSERLRGRYPISSYPDITHTVRCQQPVPWWDPVFALVENREVSNPRPLGMKLIYHATMQNSLGFIAYSEGVHDDVNKTVWNALAWDPNADVREVLTDYARFYFGPDVADRAAEGILALERNWQGAAVENASIDTTFALWERLDRENPTLRGNWRWQLCLLRAWYDEYLRHRRIHEKSLQEQAMAGLLEAEAEGSEVVMTEALAMLARADSEPVHPEWRARILEICEGLHESIGMQLSVERHGASSPQRGALMDFVDLPVNDRWWIEDEFERIGRMPSEEQKVARLLTLATWESPGPGSFYDDIGNVEQSPHVLRGEGFDTDPLFERTPNPFFQWWDNGRSRTRRAWQSDIHWPTLVYRGVDPNARYTVRVNGVGPHLLRMDGELVQPAAAPQELGAFRTYPVPPGAISDSVLTLTWDDPDEGKEHWRMWGSRVNEVWLLKR